MIRVRFDRHLLMTQVYEEKKRRKLSYAELATITGLDRTRLVEILTKPVSPAKLDRIPADTVARLMMFLGKHDIRAYLVEERM